MSHRHQARQVARTGLVAAGQAGGLHIARVLHAQLQRLGVHQLHKLRQTAGISASQGMGSTVLAGHQRQMHHLGARQGGADTQTGAAVLFGIHIVLRDGDHLVHGQTSLRDQQTRHQLGQRSNRQHCLIVLAQQHLMCVLVDHISHAALQIKGVRDGVKTRHLPIGQTCGLDCRGSSCCRNRSASGSCPGQTLLAAGLLVSFGLGCQRSLAALLACKFGVWLFRLAFGDLCAFGLRCGTNLASRFLGRFLSRSRSSHGLFGVFFGRRRMRCRSSQSAAQQSQRHHLGEFCKAKWTQQLHAILQTTRCKDLIQSKKLCSDKHLHNLLDNLSEIINPAVNLVLQQLPDCYAICSKRSDMPWPMRPQYRGQHPLR